MILRALASRARAAARSCRGRYGPTSSLRCSTASTVRWRAVAPRSSLPATTGRRSSSPPTCGLASPGRSLLPEPRRRLRVAPRAAAASRRPAGGGAGRAARHAATAERGRPVIVVSAVALSEKVPDPALRPHASRSAAASCSISTRSPASSSPPATSASTRSRTAASSRSAAGSSTSSRDRGPRGARRPLRHRDRVAATLLDLHATLARRSRRGRDRPGRRAGARASRARRDRRDRRRGGPPDVAELLPVERFHALLDLVPRGRGDPARRRGGNRTRRSPTTGRMSARPSTTPTRTSLRTRPTTIETALEARSRIRLSALSSGQPSSSAHRPRTSARAR